MPNYQNGKIYKLVNSVSNDCYYGSTCQKLAKRKSEHKRDFNCWKSGTRRGKCASYKLFDEDYDNIDIVLVESYPCQNKDELHARERWYVENHDCINKQVPGRTYKQWYQDNADKKRQQVKQYKQANKEAINEKMKQYRQDNKEAIKQQKKQKANCPHCNQEMRKDSINRHIRRKH